MTGAALSNYNQARYALQQCASIDEAKDIADKAQALKVYAAQRGDADMESWVAEIKLRAHRRVGELSKALETNEHRLHRSPEAGTPTKRAVLAEAGVSKSVAQRCEELAAVAVKAPTMFEGEIAKAREAKRPISAQVVLRKVKESKREERREANRQLIDQVPEPALVEAGAKFSTIVLDPPWDWGDEGDVDQMGRALPTYGTMPFEELLELPGAKAYARCSAAALFRRACSIVHSYSSFVASSNHALRCSRVTSSAGLLAWRISQRISRSPVRSCS